MNRPQQDFHRSSTSGRAACAPFRRATLADRQHHPRQRHRLGSAALALYPSAVRHRSQRDFAGIRERVKKMADIGRPSPPWPSAAKPRPMLRRRPTQGTARDNFSCRGALGAAQWPYDENDETNIAYNNKKRECYAKYAALADHHVEAVWVPFQARRYRRGCTCRPDTPAAGCPSSSRCPAWTATRKSSRALRRQISQSRHGGAGDRRAGTIRAPMIGLHFTMENWMAAGPALADWIEARPELDATRIAVAGTSFGSLFGTVLTANERA